MPLLCLTRKKNERIILTVPPSTTPTRIVVTTISIERDKVRLGTEAPAAVVIDREEIDQRRTAGLPGVPARAS